MKEKVAGGLLDVANTYFYDPGVGICVGGTEVLIGRRSCVTTWSCIISTSFPSGCTNPGSPNTR